MLFPPNKSVNREEKCRFISICYCWFNILKFYWNEKSIRFRSFCSLDATLKHQTEKKRKIRKEYKWIGIHFGTHQQIRNYHINCVWKSIPKFCCHSLYGETYTLVDPTHSLSTKNGCFEPILLSAVSSFSHRNESSYQCDTHTHTHLLSVSLSHTQTYTHAAHTYT